MKASSSFLLVLCFLILGVLRAAPIADDSRVLFLGTAAATHAAALQALIDGDPTANTRGITVDHFETADVRNAFFTASNGSLSHPSNVNPLQQKLDEGWDAILINPADLNIRVSPEMGMEGIRLIERYVRGAGAELFILVPTFDPAFNGDAGYKSTATDVKERAYRIADALEIGAIPVGICWQTVLADASIAAAETTLAAPNIHALNTYITTIFSELFETSAAASTYRHGGISGAEFALIAGHAHQAWQDALTATHYTGDYLGIFSPMPDVIDAANKHTGWGGASTEGMTREEWLKIYRRQGVEALRGDHKDAVDRSKDYDFYVNRGWLYDSSIDYYRSQDPGNDLRIFSLIYKSNSLTEMVGWGLSRANVYEDWFYPARVSSSMNFSPLPYKRFVPNMPGFVRYWTDFPNARAGRYGDGHLNENLIMMQASMIYTMASGGANPLENITDLEAWTGPQRYSAGLGYATIMGIGRLKKLEMAPVAIGLPRFEMTANAANSLTLPGHDFNDLPLTVEIVTPPAHGTLVPDGTDFNYTPDPAFSGIDTVTYRVNNGIEDSLPLTVGLVVEPYIPSPVSGTVFFEENFDDQNIDDWNQSGRVVFVNASSPSRTWRDGFSQPYDGTAGIWLTGAFGEIWKAIDTTGFENLQLTIRVGSGNIRDEEDYPDEALVEWYDGTTWHTAVSHGHTYFTNRLLYAYEVSLPAAAARNPDFRLRLYGEGSGDGKDWKGAYFDSIRLSGDIVPLAPAADSQTLEVAQDVPKAVTLQASDENIFDTLSYTVTPPSHGSLSGTAPDLTYTPDPGFVGVDSFTFVVNDGTFDSKTATVTLNVRNNSAPQVDAGNDMTVVAGTESWEPESTATLAWYDASDANTLVQSDGEVSQWNDKSPNARHLTQGGGSSQPTSGIRSINQKNVLDFDGNDSLAFGGFSLPSSGDLSLFIVAEVDSVGSAFTSILSMDAATDFQLDAESTPGFNGNIRCSGNASVSFTGGPFAGARLFNAVFDKTSSTLEGFVDGISRGSHSSYNTPLSESQNFRVFNNRNNGDSPDGAVAEVLILEDTSPETRQRIEGYLAHKWDLTEELPENHPHKFTGPLRTSATINLSGALSDAEGDALSSTWTQVSGPEGVSFSSPNSAATMATFQQTGTYVFRLSSDDGLEQAFDEVTVVIADAIVDLDGDGIDDTWETTHFPGQEGSFDGSTDSNGNGVQDFFEFLTGSNPHAPGLNLLGLKAGQAEVAGVSPVFQWTVKDRFVAGQHYRVLYSTDLSTWNPLPEAHYALRSNLADGMNHVEMEVTHDYGEHLFIRLGQP